MADAFVVCQCIAICMYCECKFRFGSTDAHVRPGKLRKFEQDVCAHARQWDKYYMVEGARMFARFCCMQYCSYMYD